MYCLGVAQLVARSVRDAEADGSSPFTQTILGRFGPFLLDFYKLIFDCGVLIEFITTEF